MRIQPLGDYMLVQAKDGREDDPDRVILLPDGKHLLPYGLVLETGPLVQTFKPGDKALFMPGNFIGMDEATKIGLVQESSCFGRYVDDPPLTVLTKEEADELDAGLISNPPQQEG